VSDPFSYPDLSYTATLVSPASTQYELFVYPDADCTYGNIATGSPPSYHDSWSDTPFIDDSLWIIVEVRYLSGGACGPNEQWVLTVRGHT
jgi:hypothetical protein